MEGPTGVGSFLAFRGVGSDQTDGMRDQTDDTRGWMDDTACGRDTPCVVPEA